MKLALSLLVIAPALALAQQASDAGFKPVSLQEAVTMAQQFASCSRYAISGSLAS